MTNLNPASLPLPNTLLEARSGNNDLEEREGNAKCKGKNAKCKSGGGRSFGNARCWENPVIFRMNRQRISPARVRHQQMGRYTACRGIILRAFGHLPLKQPEGAKDKTLAGMQWPHRILFEPGPRN